MTKPTSNPVKPPTVKLSWTMAELYNSTYSAKHKSKPVLVTSCPSSSVDFSEDFTRCTKFVWQDAAVNNPRQRRNLCHPLDVKYSLVAQRFAFSAGNIPVVIINGEESALKTNVEQLERSQRPELRFYDAPEDVKVSQGEVLAETLPIDALEDVPHLVKAEEHYRLLSKRDLAVSPLPTPKAKVLDIDVSPDDKKSGYKKHIETVISAVKERTPPFVVKFQQSLSGEGTFLVPDKQSQEELVEHFTKDKVLSTLFSQVNESNRHLLPSSIILSEYVAGDSVKMHGLSFFIKPNGDAVFLCSGEQDMDDENHWAGARMIYSNQQHLEEILSPVMKQIGNYLFKNDYYGPVGADILQDTKEDRFVIVDLNVRCSGSLILGSLKSHFENNGYTEAYLLTSVKFPFGREAFMEKFRSSIEEGKMVIVGWLEGKEKEGDWGSLCVAGKDHGSVVELVGKVEGVGIEGDAED